MSELSERESVLVNFRPTKGLRECVYRCGTTDALANVVGDESLTPDERIFLHSITLNMDLRSKREVDLEKAAIWTSDAPGGPFQVMDGIEACAQASSSSSFPPRAVVHCDLMSNVFRYIDTEWLKNGVNVSEAHEVRMKRCFSAIKERGGLSSLYQAILEANHEKLADILKIITMNLESNGKVIINCTQGKDRTGLLSMLLQSSVGVGESDIVDDFHASHKFDQSRRGSAAMQLAAARFKIDSSVLSGAPPEVMETTLAYLDEKYGSVVGFLNAIGFDQQWRDRLVSALDTSSNGDGN